MLDFCSQHQHRPKVLALVALLLVSSCNEKLSRAPDGSERGDVRGQALDGSRLAADSALADGAPADGALADGAPADGALADGALLDSQLTTTDGWLLGDRGSGGACTPDSTTYQGDGTSYGADGSGACSFPASPDDLMVGAMNLSQYASAATCGTCVRVKGPKPAEITIRIVDLCPGCQPGDIDLSTEAFALIAYPEHGDGRVPITWHYVDCNVRGPIAYSFPSGSNPWWTAVQVRNHRYQIAKLEYKTGSSAYKEVSKRDDNHFVEASGMGDGPYTFRVTDIYNQVLEDAAIAPPTGGGVVPGAGQFPICQ